MNASKVKVFGDGETGDQAERLVNEMKLGASVLTVFDLPIVARIGARQDLDERRFSRPVVTEERHDLPPPDRKRYAVQNPVRAKVLRYASDVQQDVLHLLRFHLP